MPAENTSLTKFVDRDMGQPGLITMPGTLAAQGAVAGRTYYKRFVPSRDMILVGQAHILSVAAGADDTCDGGIYSAAGFKQTSSGATAGKLNGTLGRKVLTYTTPYKVLAGNVYFAALGYLTPFGGTAASVLSGSFGDASGMTLFGTTLATGAEGAFESAFPLPTSMTPTVAGTGLQPCLALLE